jgi:hypothetical protein
LVYRAHTVTNWAFQQKDCVRLWVTRKRAKKVKDTTIYFKPLGPKTDYPVYLRTMYKVGSGVTNKRIEEVVFYAKNPSGMKAFMSTLKYNNALDSPWNFK